MNDRMPISVEISRREYAPQLPFRRRRDDNADDQQ